jgi:protein-disulfide isomerase
MKEGSAVDVSGTPATFVNGRKIGGAYPYEVFKKIVDQELAKKGNVAANDRRRKG